MYVDSCLDHGQLYSATLDAAREQVRTAIVYRRPHHMMFGIHRRVTYARSVYNGYIEGIVRRAAPAISTSQHDQRRGARSNKGKAAAQLAALGWLQLAPQAGGYLVHVAKTCSTSRHTGTP
eukprot:SAG31_NODE_115_length_24128_cov_47.693912_1_plen_121_part_00